LTIVRALGMIGANESGAYSHRRAAPRRELLPLWGQRSG
jgi:hypothetical protein